MIDTVYVFQHAVRNESYALLKVHPMSLMNGPPRENLYKQLTCTEVRLGELECALLDPTLVRSVCHAYRAC